MVCYGDYFLYVEGIRTSQETRLWDSTALLSQVPYFEGDLVSVIICPTIVVQYQLSGNFPIARTILYMLVRPVKPIGFREAGYVDERC
jgi:hypothetical protein